MTHLLPNLTSRKPCFTFAGFNEVTGATGLIFGDGSMYYYPGDNPDRVAAWVDSPLHKGTFFNLEERRPNRVDVSFFKLAINPDDYPTVIVDNR